MFVGLFPLIQFLRERRVSIIAIVILVIPPVFWFYISWKATGDWLACFVQRQQYHDWLLTMNPALARFSLRSVMRDGGTLLVSTDIAVLIACCVAGWFVVRELRGLHLSESVKLLLAPVVFFFAFFGLLVIAYVTHQQPIIFFRYGLIAFTLGLPILAWAFLTLRERNPEWTRRLLFTVVLILALDGSIQMASVAATLNQYSVQRAMADYLREHFDPNSSARIFCDEGTVQVLSGIPADRFLTSSDAPKDPTTFLTFLSEKRVDFLITVHKPDSLPAKLFPATEYGDPFGPYESVAAGNTKIPYMNLHVYRRR
jgi:hypothetical protein